MPIGRPTKLTQELLDKAKGYLDTCKDKVQFTDKGAMAYVDVELPTLEGFAIYLGIHKDTVQVWCKDSEGDSPELKDLKTDFSLLVKDILQEQGKRLINKGLGGLYQPKIAGMMLSKHGYIEETKSDVTSGGKPLGTYKELSNDKLIELAEGGL